MKTKTLDVYVERALFILRDRAHDGDVITYGALARKIGTHPRMIGRVLNLIWDDPARRKERDLVALVVNLKNPGSHAGWKDTGEKRKARRRARRA